MKVIENYREVGPYKSYGWTMKRTINGQSYGWQIMFFGTKSRNEKAYRLRQARFDFRRYIQQKLRPAN